MPDLVLVRTTCQPGVLPGEFEQTDRYFDRELFTFVTQGPRTVLQCAAYEAPTGFELLRRCVPPRGEGGQTDTYTTLEVIAYDRAAPDFPTVTYTPDFPACPLVSCDLLLFPLSAAYTSATSQYPGGYWLVSAGFTSGQLPVELIFGGQQTSKQTVSTSPGTATFLVTQPGTYVVQAAAGPCNAVSPPITLAPPTAPPAADSIVPLLTRIDRGTDETAGGPVEYERTVFFEWNKATRTVDTRTEEGVTGDPYSRDLRLLVDAYQLPDGRTFRQVYHNGAGGVRFTDTVPEVEQQVGEMEISNLIVTDIDEAGTPTGRVWIEAESPAPPIRYTVIGPGGATGTNVTGQFAGLPAGSWQARATDAAGRTSSDTFEVQDRYRPRFTADWQALHGESVQVFILGYDYAGEPETVCGAGNSPITRGWQGSGTDPLAPFLEVVGQTVKLSLLTAYARQFLVLAGPNDRAHRVDVYRAGRLAFRGYIAPETYREPLLSGRQAVTITASCGLGPLSEIEFLNHRQRLLSGRRPVLATILHCLSRTDLNLPLYIGGGLWDAGMDAEEEPLLQAYGQREVYNAGGDDIDKVALCRAVLEGELRGFFLQLCQRDGAWQLDAVPELDALPERRAFTAEGLPLIDPQTGIVLPPAPGLAALHIVPSAQATGPDDLYWVTAAQAVEVSPAAAAVRATVKLQLADSLLLNSDFQDWTADLSRPRNWTYSGPAGKVQAARVNADQVGRYQLDLQPGAVAGGPDAGLLSSPVRLLDGQNRSPLQLTIKARTVGLPSSVGEPRPEPRIVRLPVQLLVNGAAAGLPLLFEYSSADKADEQQLLLPGDLGTGQLRLRLGTPELLAGPAPSAAYPLRVLVESVALAVVPAARSWPTEDRFLALNPTAGTGIVLPAVELVHADIPRLALPNGLPGPVSEMDVLAWRHALSLPDGSATTGWVRRAPTVAEPDPEAPAVLAGIVATPPAPLLELAAMERLELRTAPAVGLTGVVSGPAVGQVGVGRMLDAVTDEPGRFAVVSCQTDELQDQATIVVRRLRAGSYTEAPTGPTGRVRFTSQGPRYAGRQGFRRPGA